MILVYSIVLGLAAAYYAALISFFAAGFRRVRREITPDPSKKSLPGEDVTPFVSIVIAARNEADSILSCLQSILANEYPASRLEVIVVDDFSEDETAAIVQQLQNKRRPVTAGYVEERETDEPPLRLVRMQDHASSASGHKRHALQQGIAMARGDLVLTTDADCTVGPRWIQSMIAYFNADTGFVAGPVRYRPGPTLFGRLQALEFLALVATGAGGIGMGRPNMCNSANVAYRRDVYERFSTLPNKGPADDEVLAQRLAADTAWNVRFCAHIDALVETDPVLNLRAFWTQRRRWAGTGPRYPHNGLVAIILGVYLFYMLLFWGGIALPFIPALWPAVAVALVLKVGAETSLLLPACRHFGQRWLFRYFLPEQLVQIPYVVLIGLAAALGRTHWKGRQVFR